MSASSDSLQRGGGPAARGLSLIELVVCITLIGVVAAMLVDVFGRMAGRSADPLVQRQALAVAESMLQEVLAQGTGTTDQSGVADGMGPEPGESRTGGGTLFDHVNDYNGLDMPGMLTTDGSAVPGLQAYRVRVAVRQQAMGVVPDTQGLWVEVRVTAPGGSEVLLASWRARF